MKASDLLAIDLAGELQAVCREQLRASWQVAAELARLGLQRGAEAIEARSLRNGFVLGCAGASLGAAELADLHVAAGGSSDVVRRHDAVERLEASQAQALLWALGIAGSRVEVTAWQGGSKWALRARLDDVSTLDRTDCPGRTSGFEIRVTSPRLERRRTLGWLGSALRFTPVPVRIDGERLGGGFERCLFETRIDRPLAGRIAVTSTGDAPHLWLLRHGVLATRAAVPGFPAFEAALEVGESTRAGAGPDELREAVNPHLPALIDRAVAMMVEAADRLPSLTDEGRERLVCLLLRAARKGLRRERILGLPLVRVTDGSPEALWWTPRQLAERGRDGLACEDPDHPRRGEVGDGALVVLASVEQRGLLAELLGISLQRVPRLSRPFGPRRTVAALGRVPARLSQLLWGASCGRVVPREDLLSAEIELLDELNRRAAPPTEVRLCAGAGPVRRRGRVLLLPRRHQLVTESVRMVSDGEGWRYPVVLALLGDRVGPLDELRDRWVRATLALDGTDHPGQWRSGARSRRPVRTEC
jgi:hypothetical protein